MEEYLLLTSEGFQVYKTLGRGAFGQVFLVHHPDTGVVAAKVMKNENFDENEWNITKLLNNEPPQTFPFIIRSIMARQFSTFTVILMEYANQKNLFDMIKTNDNLSTPIIRVIMKQLLQGLNYIHSKGIVHRDIKGGNIMLHNPPGSRRIIIQIGDFGEVKISEGNPMRTMIMSQKGTNAFMAPELFLGNSKGPVVADAKV